MADRKRPEFEDDDENEDEKDSPMPPSGIGWHKLAAARGLVWQSASE